MQPGTPKNENIKINEEVKSRWRPNDFNDLLLMILSNNKGILIILLVGFFFLFSYVIVSY